MIMMIPYEPKLKDGVFAFTKKCFEKLGKNFEPEGRHECYNDIERHYVKFFCLVEGNRIVGTVALKKLHSMSKYTDAIKLYEKVGFKHIERYNDNQYADVFMKMEI